MKKFIILLFGIFFTCLSISAKGEVEMKLSSVSVDYDEASSLTNSSDSFMNSEIYVMFRHIGDRFLSIMISNRTKQEIEIEWGSSFINGSPIVFSNSLRLNMYDKIPPEKLYQGQKTSLYDFTSRIKVGRSGLHPLYDKKLIKKGGIEESIVEIPIKIKDEIKVYRFTLQFYWEQDK